MLTTFDLLLCLEYVDCGTSNEQNPQCGLPDSSLRLRTQRFGHVANRHRTYWVVIYDGLLVLLLIGMAVAAVFHMTTIARHMAHAGSDSGLKNLLISQATVGSKRFS